MSVPTRATPATGAAISATPTALPKEGKSAAPASAALASASSNSSKHKTAPAPVSLVPGGQVEHFQLGEILSEDSLGRRFAATDTRDDRSLVFLLLSEFLPHCGEDAVKGFLDEAKQAALVKKPGVIRPLRIGKAGDRLYAVLPFVAGGNLAEDLALNGPMTPREATRILLEVAQLVGALHAGRVLHRDLKPENVLLGEDGQIWLAGAGFTRALEELQQFRLGVPVANPLTCSPELYRDGEADPRSDVYGLGVLYYMLLTARPPFVGDTSLQTLHKHCTEPLPDPRELNPVVTDGCVAVLERAMAKAPADRYATAQEFADALERLKQNLPGSSSSRQTRIPVGGQRNDWHGAPGSSGLSSSDILTASAFLKPLTGPSGVGPIPGAAPSLQQLRPPTSSASSDELAAVGSGLAGSGLANTTAPGPTAVSANSSNARITARPSLASGSGSGLRSMTEVDSSSSRRQALSGATSAGEMSVVMPAVGAPPRAGSPWLLAVLIMLVLGSITTVLVLTNRPSVPPDPVKKKDDTVSVNMVATFDDGSGPTLPTLPDTTPTPVSESYHIPENPEPPPAAERVAMLAAAVAKDQKTPPGWTAQPPDAWSFDSHRRAAAGLAKGESPVRLSATLPTNSFDVSLRVRVDDKSVAMLEFHHRARGHLFIRLDSRGLLRLMLASGETATENLEFKQLTLTAESTQIRLLAELGEVAVHINGVPVIRSRGLRRADREPPQLTLAAVGGRCEFSELTYSPRTEKTDLRRAQVLDLLSAVADPTCLDRVSDVLSNPTDSAAALPVALQILGASTDRRAEELLRKLVSSPGDLPASFARQATVLLGKKHSPESRAVLEKMLSHPDPQLRRVAVEAYGEQTDPNLDRLTGLLEDESNDVGMAAVAALGRVGSSEALGRVQAARNNPKLRNAANGILLSRLDQPVGFEALLEALSSQDAGLRGQARNVFVTRFAELRQPLAQQIREGKITPEVQANLRSILASSKTRRWMLAGPFEPQPDLDDKHGPDYIKRSAFMDRPDFLATYTGASNTTVRWFGTDADGSGSVNLANVLNSKNRWLVYGYTTVYSDKEREHNVYLQSDDWMAVWVNKKHVATTSWGENKQRGKTIKIQFKAGANIVFIACDNRGGSEWFFKLGLPAEPPFPELAENK